MRFTLHSLSNQHQQSWSFGLKKGRKILFEGFCLLLVSLGPARAGELGHFSPGALNILDVSDVNAGFNPKDQVHAGGGQIGLTYVPWKEFIAFHGLQEFGAEALFEGPFFTWTIGKGF